MNLIQYIYAPIAVGLLFQLSERMFGKNDLLLLGIFASQLMFAIVSGFTIKNLALLTIIFCIFYFIVTYSKMKNTNRDIYQISLLVLSLYLFVWFSCKYLPTFAGWMPIFDRLYGAVKHIFDPAYMIGVSYLGFKLIHFFIDCYDGKIKNSSFYDFLCWLFFSPCIVAGPIQRFQEWQQSRVEVTSVYDNVKEGTIRIVEGLFKKIVVADLIYSMSIASLGEKELLVIGITPFVFSVFVYSIYIYMDFSGYSDIAIGISRFWGIKIPENFNYPYMKRDIQEFWGAWHMTLSRFLRDYIYFPLGGSRKGRLRTYLNFVIVFVLCGIWHGPTVGFVLWGALHGLALAATVFIRNNVNSNNVFQIWWRQSKLGHGVAVIINFSIVSFFWIPFALDNGRLIVLMKRLIS